MANQSFAEDSSSQAEGRDLETPENPDLGDKFHDIDDADSFTACRARLMHEGTRNFVVDFGNDEARCAIDLEDADFSALMDPPVSPILAKFVSVISE